MGVTLPELIDERAKWVLISNYMIDMRFLLSACPSLLTAEHLIFAHGEYKTPANTSRWWAPQTCQGCKRAWAVRHLQGLNFRSDMQEVCHAQAGQLPAGPGRPARVSPVNLFHIY